MGRAKNRNFHCISNRLLDFYTFFIHKWFSFSIYFYGLFFKFSKESKQANSISNSTGINGTNSSLGLGNNSGGNSGTGNSNNHSNHHSNNNAPPPPPPPTSDGSRFTSTFFSSGSATHHTNTPSMSTNAPLNQQASSSSSRSDRSTPV
jgi:hypothetical protein